VCFFTFSGFGGIFRRHTHTSAFKFTSQILKESARERKKLGFNISNEKQRIRLDAFCSHHILMLSTKFK